MEEAREVELAEAEAISESYEEVISVLETSAKEDTNVTEAMLTLAKKLKDQHGSASESRLTASGDRTGGTAMKSGGFRLDGNSVGGKRNSCCPAFG